MSRALQSLAILAALLCGGLPACTVKAAEKDAALERGAAIVDPAALRELDRGPFGLGRLLEPARSAGIPLASSELFTLPSMAPVHQALDAEFDRYVTRHEANLASETIGVGEGFDFQLFDRAQLASPDTRFMLAGIVNRMDRAYVAQAECGEIRLIYRLIRTDAPPVGENVVSARLPMTLNVVLKAKSGSQDAAITCAEIARRWLAAGALSLTGTELAERLLETDGPLAQVGPQNVDRIETNLQIAHAPKSAVRDFRTDYLLKVFRYNAAARRFDEAPMENQIDGARILADANLKRDFKAWLLEPGHFGEFDRGTLLIPERFLATAAIAPTPIGLEVSDLQPEFGLMHGEGATTAPLFSESDVVAALKQAAEAGVTLQNVRSPGGFERRLNDITCSGCHQTRGIGGFHFPGVDWMAAKPSNSTVVPASPHFFGDQVRRRDILAALRDGREPDYSRGFSARAQRRGSSELAGTEYDDGWGAHCSLPGAKPTDNDDSFRGWGCTEGLSCQIAGKSSRIGMCFVRER
jgi:hypothetical protein